MIRLLSLMLLLGSASTITAQTVAELRDKANDYEEREKYKRAIKVYDELIEMEPDSVRFHVLRARMHYYNGDVEACMEGFSKTMKQFPKHWYPYHNRSLVYDLMHLWEKGVLDAKEAVQYAPTDSIRGICLATLGTIYWQIREFEKSKVACIEALEIDSTNEVALNSYAMVLSELKEQEEALKVLQQLYELDTVEYHFALHNKAFIYMELQRYEESLEMFNEVIERSPDDAYAHSNRSFVKLQLGEPEEALKDVNRSIKLGPNNAYAYMNRAKIYLELGEQEEACEDLEQSLRLNFTIQYGDEVDKLYKSSCF